MTVTSAPMSPDLIDTPCSVAECLDPAHSMGRARVRVDAPGPVPSDLTTMTFGLPLCLSHAQLLAHGCRLEGFDSGL